MKSLKSAKVKVEKDFYIEELMSTIPDKEDLLDGNLNVKANRLHGLILPVYVTNYYKPDNLKTPYFDVILTNFIEMESLFILGFKNSGYNSLRAIFESALKLLYYECHPIEFILHKDKKKHNLTVKEYREFMYSHPSLEKISFILRDKVEKLYSDLCEYVHCDLKVHNSLRVVSNITSILKYEESEFNKILASINQVLKLTVVICFAVNSKWLSEAPKSYFDAVLETFSNDERKEVRENIGIH